MLTRLRRHPLLAGAAEVLVDATLYVAALLALIMLLGQLVKLAAAAP